MKQIADWYKNRPKRVTLPAPTVVVREDYVERWRAERLEAERVTPVSLEGTFISRLVPDPQGTTLVLGTLLEFTEVPASNTRIDALRVVLCGSFRKRPDRLRDCFTALTREFHVLSPRSVDFTDPSVEFVRLADEESLSHEAIEELHLSALKASDFVWLHCPDGYVGTSAAMELGHARAIGLPVFATEMPSDPVLATGVNIVSDVADVVPLLLRQTDLPGHGLERLQHYYLTTAQRRGWANEKARRLQSALARINRSKVVGQDHGRSGSQVDYVHADVLDATSGRVLQPRPRRSDRPFQRPCSVRPYRNCRTIKGW